MTHRLLETVGAGVIAALLLQFVVPPSQVVVPIPIHDAGAGFEGMAVLADQALIQEACGDRLFGRLRRDVQFAANRPPSSSSNVVNQINLNLDILQQQIDAIAAQQGQPGTPGPPGMNGQDGRDGVDGKDGVSPSIEDIVSRINMQQIVSLAVQDVLTKLPEPVPGPAGERGPPGESRVGPAGPPGPPGTVANLDYEDIVRNLPPFWFRVVDPTGQFQTSPAVEVYLGQQLNLVLEPATAGLPGSIQPDVSVPTIDGGAL